MADPSGSRILLLDDDPFMLKLLSMMLNRLGRENITAFCDGSAALAYLDQSSGAPDLILFDMQMPQMGGAAFVHQLALRGYAGSLVIASGEPASQDAESIDHERGIRILGYLPKPFALSELSQVLDRLETLGAKHTGYHTGSSS